MRVLYLSVQVRTQTISVAGSLFVDAMGEIGVCILRSSSAPSSLIRCFCSLCTRHAFARPSIASCSERERALFSATSRSVDTMPQDLSVCRNNALMVKVTHSL